MTDARMPERYLMDRRIARLSADQFRAFCMATLWSVSNRTDGVIADQDLALIPSMQAMIPTHLIAAGLWGLHDEGYLILDFASTQTSKHDLDVLDNARRADREKKARQRANKNNGGPGDDPRDVSPGTTQARTGEARTGQDRQGEAVLPSHVLTAVPPFESDHNEMQRDALADWGVPA